MTIDEQDPETFTIIGAAMAVRRELGCGFLETVYQEALGKELISCKVPHIKEQELPVYYRGERLNPFYKADFICFGSVIIEIKALKNLSGTEEAQIINYLKASRLQRALLINFGTSRLEFKRFVRSL
jgi:GxxExxY protein